MADHSAHSAAAPGHTAGHAHTAGHGHGGHGHGAHDVRKEIRKYMIVFAALLVGTIVTVLASYVDFGGHGMNIAVALVIAIVKGALVACFFMHLIDERKLIYGVLGATVFFFVGLMYLTLWSSEPGSFIRLKQPAGAERTATQK